MSVQLLSLEKIKEGLADRRLYKVSKLTGLSYPTLKKLSDGVDANYTMSTIKAVSKYISDSAIEKDEKVMQ